MKQSYFGHQPLLFIFQFIISGESATHNCVSEGDEWGSDQYGGQIMIAAQEKDMNLTRARIEYIEVTYAGQAFRLARYPIHFHLLGDISNSYVSNSPLPL